MPLARLKPSSKSGEDNLPDIELFIQEDGRIKSVYDDELHPVLRELGKIYITRASRVEPDQPYSDLWRVEIDTCDLLTPTWIVGRFYTRAEALEKEKEFLSLYYTTGKLFRWEGKWVGQ
jgi:hypothetical protein